MLGSYCLQDWRGDRFHFTHTAARPWMLTFIYLNITGLIYLPTILPSVYIPRLHRVLNMPHPPALATTHPTPRASSSLTHIHTYPTSPCPLFARALCYTISDRRFGWTIHYLCSSTLPPHTTRRAWGRQVGTLVWRNDAIRCTRTPGRLHTHTHARALHTTAHTHTPCTHYTPHARTHTRLPLRTPRSVRFCFIVYFAHFVFPLPARAGSAHGSTTRALLLPGGAYCARGITVGASPLNNDIPLPRVPWRGRAWLSPGRASNFYPIQTIRCCCRSLLTCHWLGLIAEHILPVRAFDAVDLVLPTMSWWLILVHSHLPARTVLRYLFERIVVRMYATNTIGTGQTT